MEKLSRSKTSRERVMQPTSMNGLRSYSTSGHERPPNPDQDVGREMKLKKVSSSKICGVNLEAELQRKKRVAGYRAYEMEGKVKGSVKRSFRWIKDACNHVVHGIW